jgi:outer membrane protein OmpA-like peptidoglycan-associated protein
MATNLLDTIESYLTPEVLQKISSVVGESPANTQKAMEGTLPTLLAGLTNFSSSGDGATQLANLLSQGDYSNLISNLPSLLSGGNATQNLMSSGREILNMLFGGKLSAIIDLIANSSGIKSASASSLLSIAAPLLLGVLGKEKAAQGLSISGLVNLLIGQKDQITRQAPIGLAGILGLSNLANLGSKVAGTATRLASDAATQVRYEGVREGSSLWKWLVPALGLLALASLYSLWGGSPQVNKESLVPRALSGLTLPGGMTLSLREGSFNYNLAKFLADTTDTSVSKAFIFDNVNFDSATTRLTAESERTVNDLINILKAYPTTEVRLEGHTDSTGDSEENKKLSQARAEAVKESLVRGGIDASRITTAGFGQEKPIASNDTEDGRAKNRRLELVVAKK